MRKMFLILVVLLLSCGVSFAATGASFVSSNSVSFNTVGKIVTFNTVINHVLLINESATDTVHVTFTGLGWTTPAQDTYVLPVAQGASPSTVATIPMSSAFKLTAGSSLSLDINTTKIGFIKNTSSLDSGNVNYLVTSEQGQP